MWGYDTVRDSDRVVGREGVEVCWSVPESVSGLVVVLEGGSEIVMGAVLVWVRVNGRVLLPVCGSVPDSVCWWVGVAVWGWLAVLGAVLVRVVWIERVKVIVPVR